MDLPIRYFSDLHLNFENDASRKVKRVSEFWAPCHMKTDCDTVLVLAGDIWEGVRPLSYAGQSWMRPLSERFRAVVVVLGNHDFYGENLSTLRDKWRGLLKEQGLNNVHLLDVLDAGHESIRIDDVTFVGTTLWTDMGGNNAAANVFEFETAKGMNGRALWSDRDRIRVGKNFRKFGAADWVTMHSTAKQRLSRVFSESPEATVLVTHHAPFMLSQRNDLLESSYYCSDLSALIRNYPQIKLCIHGHLHESHAYSVDGVEVRCNPRGYTDQLNPGFSEAGFYLPAPKIEKNATRPRL